VTDQENILKHRHATRRRVAYVGLALAVAVAVVGAGPFALDYLGYCVEDVLPGDVELSTEPYLQQVTEDSAVVRWWSADESGGTVAWGNGESLSSEATVDEGPSPHEARLTGLQPGQEYRYRVQGTDIDAEGTFRSAPDAQETVTIGVVGDTGTGGDEQFEVAGILESMEPDLLLHTGDVVYRRGALCDYEEKFFDPYEDLVSSTALHAAVGNHDLDAKDGAAFDEVFGIERDGERWRSFDFGPVHVVVLDSEIYFGSDGEAVAAQRAWLEEELSETTLPWTIVVTHRPLYSSTPDKVARRIRDDLAPVFVSGGVDLVVAGHAHNYERFAPINGVTYVVSGGGGAELHQMEPGPDTAAAAVAYHAVKLVVSPDSLVIEAIDRDGSVIDEARLESQER
jgi:hypothetical protein